MIPDPDEIELVEFGTLSFADWARLVGGNPTPFGDATAGLEFRPKDHHVGVRDGGGPLLAVAGVTIVTVEVDGQDPFEVVGVGALIVRRDMRGRGLANLVMDRVTELVGSLGPSRAMIFCEPELVPLYRRRDYRRITDPVWADQPSGQVQVPLGAMWRPVRPASWPAGTVRLHGQPF